MNNLSSIPAYGGTFCLTHAGLAEGTNANTYKTVNATSAISYCIKGIMYTLAPADNIAFAIVSGDTAITAQADLTTCLYLIQVDSAGTLTFRKGVEVLTADLTAGSAVLEIPQPYSADYCPIGLIQVATSGGTFTPATTDLGAATVTDVYRNVFALPSRPLTAALT